MTAVQRYLIEREGSTQTVSELVRSVWHPAQHTWRGYKNGELVTRSGQVLYAQPTTPQALSASLEELLAKVEERLEKEETEMSAEETSLSARPVVGSSLVDAMYMAAERVDNSVMLDPDIMGGSPVVAGTRIPISFVLSTLLTEEREAVELVQAVYPQLTAEQIKAAIRFVCELMET